MSGRVLILTLWICISIRAADTQSDPAVALAQILVANGTITAAQLETVSAASGSARVAALASILQRKGLLTESDIAQLRTGSANAGPSRTGQQWRRALSHRSRWHRHPHQPRRVRLIFPSLPTTVQRFRCTARCCSTRFTTRLRRTFRMSRWWSTNKARTRQAATRTSA